MSPQRGRHNNSPKWSCGSSATLGKTKNLSEPRSIAEWVSEALAWWFSRAFPTPGLQPRFPVSGLAPFRLRLRLPSPASPSVSGFAYAETGRRDKTPRLAIHYSAVSASRFARLLRRARLFTNHYSAVFTHAIDMPPVARAFRLVKSAIGEP